MPFNPKAMQLLLDDMDITEDDITTLKLVFGLFGKELDTLKRRVTTLEQNQPNIKIQGGSRTI